MSDAIRFSALHTWARTEVDGTVSVGITAHAQHELGELQYLGLPRVGSQVTKDRPFGEIESSKTVSDLYAPCGGTVVAVNDLVVENPSIINHDPYVDGWMLRVAPADPDELGLLVDQAAYDTLIATEAH